MASGDRETDKVMNVYNIVIVEDDAHSAARIREYLERYANERGLAFRITSLTDGVQAAESCSGTCDLILMDIELPLMDGMSAAETIRRTDGDVEIVFITNSPHYAIKGYRVGALDYVLKPVDYYPFSQVMDRAVGRLAGKEGLTLLLNVRGGRQKVDARRILYVEVRDHELTFHTLDGDINAKGTLREIKDALEGRGFFHCNKGYLINLARVDGVSGGNALVGGAVIPVGRAHKKAFMDALNDTMK